MQRCNNILIWSHKICISIIDAIRVAVLSETDLSANTEGAGSLVFYSAGETVDKILWNS